MANVERYSLSLVTRPEVTFVDPDTLLAESHVMLLRRQGSDSTRRFRAAERIGLMLAGRCW
jgi:hypothetical protein